MLIILNIFISFRPAVWIDELFVLKHGCNLFTIHRPAAKPSFLESGQNKRKRTSVDNVAGGSKDRCRNLHPPQSTNINVQALVTGGTSVKSVAGGSKHSSRDLQPLPSPKSVAVHGSELQQGEIGRLMIQDINAKPNLPWHIIGRVSRVSKRDFQSTDSAGFLLSFEMCDESTKTIRVMGYDTVAERFVDLENGSVYVLSKTYINPKSQFSNTGHPYELRIKDETTIEKYHGDLCLFHQGHRFEMIEEILVAGPRLYVDTFGRIESFRGERNQMVGGKMQKACLVNIVDDKGKRVAITLWNDDAVNFVGKVGEIMLINNAKIMKASNMPN